MKTVSLFGMALVLALSVSCKQNENTSIIERPAEEVAPDYAPSGNAEPSAAEESDKAKPEVFNSENNLSSSAAVERKDPERKFIRTADIKFKVKDVAKATSKVEDAVADAGGFVINTELKSEIGQTRDAKKSEDSIVRTTSYTVFNDMIIRVPNTNLDTTLKTISKEVGYLDYRIIKAEDVNLQLKANDLEQKRLAHYQKRVENAVDQKGRKLRSITDTENELLNKQETSDNSQLRTMELNDKIAYSTVALKLYQDEAVKSVTLANLDSMAFRTSFSTQVLDSLRSGWYILEAIIVFLLNLWPFILGGGLAWFGWKKMGRKKVVF